MIRLFSFILILLLTACANNRRAVVDGCRLEIPSRFQLDGASGEYYRSYSTGTLPAESILIGEVVKLGHLAPIAEIESSGVIGRFSYSEGRFRFVGREALPGFYPIHFTYLVSRDKSIFFQGGVALEWRSIVICQ